MAAVARRAQYQAAHLWARIAHARRTLPPRTSSLRAVFEDPQHPDEPARIMVPDAHWMAMALHGDILPPISAYLTLPLVQVYARSGVLAERRADGATAAATRWRMASEGWRFAGEKVVPGHQLHASAPLPAMTEAQAMEYLVCKDVPHHVWAKRGNQRRLVICHMDQIPDRTFRDAWEVAQ